MNKLRFNNTYKSGTVTYLIFKEGKNKWVGVCLEFDLEVQANTPQEAKEQIEDYSHLWLENAVKNKLPETVLNRPAPKKYWAMFEEAIKQDSNRLQAEKHESSSVDLKPQKITRFQAPYPNFAFC